MEPSINCHFCNQNHSCRDCPLEKKMSPILKEAIGHNMEYIAAHLLCCPMCGEKSLRVRGDNSASRDLDCDSCGRFFEVKSKALSYEKDYIPSRLVFPHGSFYEYNKRVSEGLHIILLIYSINRKTKTIQVNEIFHVPNKILKKEIKQIVHVTQRSDSHLSYIDVKRKQSLKEITPKELHSFSFVEEFEILQQMFNIQQSNKQSYL
jgi:hypothetical protein